MEQNAMTRLTFGLAAVAAGLVLAPNLASALSAVTAEATDLRAGPAFDFPVVDSLPSDARVNVHGCVRGYRWCDVSWRDARGWVRGEELVYLNQGRRVTIVEYGPRIGLPVVAYSFDSYWDRYYRSRPFYAERTRWRNVWREREGGDRRAGERTGREGRIENRTDRRELERTGREGRIENRTDRRELPRTERTGRDLERTDRSREGRREAERRQGDNERRMDRRTDREERSNVRTGRGDNIRERGETRGYNPQINSGPRQESNRGGRAEQSVRTPRGPEGHPGGAAGRGEGRENHQR
jgi:uncharacterized protein YraI